MIKPKHLFAALGAALSALSFAPDVKGDIDKLAAALGIQQASVGSLLAPDVKGDVNKLAAALGMQQASVGSLLTPDVRGDADNSVQTYLQLKFEGKCDDIKNFELEMKFATSSTGVREVWWCPPYRNWLRC